MSEENGKTDLTLGMRELRHLHIYIAYKEQKMYVSALVPCRRLYLAPSKIETAWPGPPERLFS